MKKVVAVLLTAVLLVLACAACGGNTTVTGPGPAQAPEGENSSAAGNTTVTGPGPAQAPEDNASSAPGNTTVTGPGPVTSGTGEPDLLATIQERGTIIVAMEGMWAPWTYHDENNDLVGYDTEVAKAIAGKLGVEAEFVEGEWDGLFAGLESGRYDMVCNGVDVTPERSASYDFTEPYAYTRTALVVRKGNEEIKTFEDLNGKVTANSIGSTYMEMAEEYGATVEGVDTLDETIQVVLQGRVDATLNADVSFYDYLGQHPDAEIEIVDQTEEANPIAIPLRKGDEAATLREAINQAITELRDEGVLTQLSEKYFGSDISK